MNKVKDKYNKETGMFATNSDGYFTEDYIDWLEEMVEKQLTLTDVVKQSELFNCYEMHAYSRFDGCNKQCKECADNEKSKAI